MGNHAILSASSSHRWMNCPPSVRLTEHMSDNGSVYATEGSEAHALCEYKLRQVLGQDAQNPLESPGGLQYYDNAMEDAATGYAAFVLEELEEIRRTCPDPIVMVEQRLDFSRWVKDGFGTGDAVIVRTAPCNRGHEVRNRRPVSAENKARCGFTRWARWRCSEVCTTSTPSP